MVLFGNQPVQARIALRERLEELRDGPVDGAWVVHLRTHCLALCAALDELGREHRIVSEAPAREVDGVAALGDFTHEEREIADLLSASTGRLGDADAALITRATTVTDG
ncbi:hypothetical protein FHX81_0192 [Saccharothrix saharensis]|uniref:Uncharacterized protein n=1 Tax=Saccharothrix saharensis TaxID=571190 RepID=A0A543J524_9PSEU|nr:hypothetical protein [Saccharothrix saharensis]TQM77945.1 hypothetical protein FHX81_0192 [Saccharothrix saharensis]